MSGFTDLRVRTGSAKALDETIQQLPNCAAAVRGVDPMTPSIEYFDCCRHCGENCGAKDMHRFPCNACQPRVKKW